MWDRREYSKFIQKPLFYLDTELKVVREGDLYRGICPIGKLGKNGDFVQLQLVHCDHFHIALEQWDRRIRRINRNNLFVKMGFSNNTPEEDKKYYFESFKSVPYNKVMFYNGMEHIDGVFNSGNERFIWSQTTADRVNLFSYNDYCRVNYFFDLDLLKLLTGDKNYSRYTT